MVVILLFVGIAVQPSIGISNNDNPHPGTTHSLDPLEPDGENGWYVNDITVTLNATDNFSGVKEIRYTINDGAEQVIPGDSGTFILSEDGEDIRVQYWAIDNAGNVGRKKLILPLIDIDQTPPEVELNSNLIELKPLIGYYCIFTMDATDGLSGMNRVEFYLNDKRQKTISGPGPDYEWEFQHPFLYYVRGLICNPEITDEYVKFYAIIVKISRQLVLNTYSACAYDNAGNMAKEEIGTFPYIERTTYTFKQLGFPNDYVGYIGRHFVIAVF